MRLFQLAADRYESVRAYLELARLQARSKETPAALATLAKAREIAPNSEDVLSAYAQLALASQAAHAGRSDARSAHSHVSVGRAVSLSAWRWIDGDRRYAGGSRTRCEAANRLEPDRALTLLALGLS